MYKFLKDWPKDREMGWSSELSGVCHDNDNWYFTQDGNLWKFPLSHSLNDSCKSENPAKGILKRTVGHKLGDFDWCGGYLFVPVVGDGKPYIQVYRASDLKPICRDTPIRFGKYFHKINWCAIDPRTGILYTSDDHLGPEFSTDWSPLMTYRLNFDMIEHGEDGFLIPHKYFDVYDENGNALIRKYMKGGCFDMDGHLFLSNGLYTIKAMDHNYANDKGGISVFEINQRGSQVEDRGTLCRIAKSSQSKSFKFQFDGTGQEPRGLTHWNLKDKKVAGSLCGQLHVIMIDNCGTGADDFYFKHYEENTSYSYTVCEPQIRKRGVIITNSRKSASCIEREKREDNRQMISELFRKRKIDYTIIVDPNKKFLGDMIRQILPGDLERAYTYINCHGANGFIEIGTDIDLPPEYDATDVYLRYAGLAEFYSHIQEKKFFLLESCNSGSARGILEQNTYLLCSAEEDKNARGDVVFGSEATRYWCAGAGSDFIAGADDDLEADDNRDGKVTLHELLTYTNGKLEKRRMPTRCVAYPKNCNEVIFD